MFNSKYNHFTIEVDSQNVVTVSLCVAGRPMNVLDWSVMNELDQVVAELEQCKTARVVVFRSHKESGFLAGADVHGIAKITSPEEVRRLINFGQGLFNRIENLKAPTIAVIHGPCLGGGLEWALACDYRIARNNSSTQIGLPEIKLGLIPAWGGTQRLPRLVGMRSALDLILQGKSVDAMKAKRIGLVDRAIEPEAWDHEVAAFIDSCLKRKLLPRRRSGDGFLTRWLTIMMARRQTRSQQLHYPAIAAAIEAIKASANPKVDGFEIERENFAGLIATPTCRNLLDLFTAREAARNPGTWIRNSEDVNLREPIRKIGIVGAGIMGAGIAQWAATRGFTVAIKEIDGASVEAGRKRIHDLVNSQAKRKSLGVADLADLLGRIRISSDAAALDDCDLVIEAAVEKETVKAAIFRSLGTRTDRNAILTSNTSSLSIESMANVTEHPNRVAGLHFFNPVHRMDLVEVVVAPQTDQETVARLVGLVRALGKTPVVAKDSPGIVVNRVLFPYLGEAVRMVSEGYDVEQIDKALRAFGMPMGPLELLDQVGIDIALHVANSLRDVLPEAESVVGPLAALAEHDQLGKKSGSGFYRYVKGTRRGVSKLPPGVRLRGGNTNQALPNKNDELGFRDDTLTPIQRRLVYPMLIEAVRCLELGIVDQPWAVDLAMVLGTGFAPHRGGPLHMIDAIGRDTFTSNLIQLRSLHGARFSTPQFTYDAARMVDDYQTY
jgi:3-hydroxyacyl-CoA dehydrogenase/enoyl-CoA hydratase/3-hydroxybutyryl-CoA epimerase